MRIEDKNKSKNSFSGNTSNITIHSCAESGDLSGLVRFLVRNPLLINEKHFSCRLIMVAKKKVNVDIKFKRLWLYLYEMLHTPLHASSGLNRYEIVKYLLEWRGPMNLELEATNVNHITPLHLAVGFALRSGDNSIVKLLLEFNANCSAADDEGMLAFNYIPATGYEHEELCQLVRCESAGQSSYNNGYNSNNYNNVNYNTAYSWSTYQNVEEPRNYKDDSDGINAMDEFDR